MEVTTLLVGLIVFLAAFTQSLSGFGVALVAMALLPSVIGIHIATPLVALVALVLEFVLVMYYRQSLQVRAVWHIALAAVIGTPLGVLFLVRVEESIALAVLGVVIAGYALYALLGLKMPRLEKSFWAYLAGLTGGMLGGAYNTSGPPVIVYADSHTSKDALLAYKELRSWGYANTTVLKDGFAAWQTAGLPTESGPAAAQIVFEKKLAPGAIAPEEFMALQQAGDAVLVIDVRSDQEVAAGKIAGARHLPLEKLEDAAAELPRDQEILVYCANGIRAEMAHQTLNGMGIKNRYLNETVSIGKDGNYKL